MNKDFILNIIKIFLLLSTILCWYLIRGEDLGIVILTILLPIITFYMNRYKKRINKGKFIFNVIRKIITFFTLMWILLIISILLKDIFKHSFIYLLPTWVSYFSITIYIIMIIDIFKDVTTYKNNIVIPLCLISLLVLIRQYNRIYLIYDYDNYYLYINSIILFIITLLTWINGYIELIRNKKTLN